MNDQEDFAKHKTAAALHLTDEFGKMGHTRQKCALSSEKPWEIGV